jgi:hypothetical protein
LTSIVRLPYYLINSSLVEYFDCSGTWAAERPAAAFHGCGSRDSLSGYNAVGTLDKFGFVRGRFAQLQPSHAMILAKPLLCTAERINGLSKKIRMACDGFVVTPGKPGARNFL